ncbi:MAG TPA: hypothetical protein VGK73_33000 [Polyangiaceae bacterium]
MNRSNRPKPSRLFRTTFALLLGGLLAFSACSQARNQEITGETHFLKLCDPAADTCGEGLACVCGVCTRACDVNSECSAFPPAQCVASTSLPQACGDAQPASRCDVGCRSNADCGVLSSSHRCELGFCRAGSSSGGTAGTGGGGGTGSAGGGGSDAGAAGAGACVSGELEGNQVVVLGDTFMALSHRITAGVEELARAAGALPESQRYRDASTIVNNALAVNGNGILNQYGRAVAEAPVAVVIMNGGGADVLAGTCEDPAAGTCPFVSSAAAGAGDLFARMASDGVAHVIYAFYPDPVDAGVREKMDALRPEVEAACGRSPVPCHFLDLRPVFEGRYADYIAADGLNPTAAGSLAAASAIWATMQEHCVAQ